MQVGGDGFISGTFTAPAANANQAMVAAIRAASAHLMQSDSVPLTAPEIEQRMSLRTQDDASPTPTHKTIYHSPLVKQAQSFYERSNTGRAERALKLEGREAIEAQLKKLHDFNNEVMPFIPFLAHMLAEKITHLPPVDEGDVSRMLTKITADNAPQPSDYPDEEQYTKASTGYIMGVDLLAKQIKLELAGPAAAPEGMSIVSSEGLHPFVPVEEASPTTPIRTLALRPTPLSRPERRPLEPDAVAATQGDRPLY